MTFSVAFYFILKDRVLSEHGGDQFSKDAASKLQESSCLCIFSTGIAGTSHPSGLHFYVGTGDLNSGPHACLWDKYFTHSVISPASLFYLLKVVLDHAKDL